MAQIIITVSSRPETKSITNDFNISHSFSQIKATKLVIMELITFLSKYWQWQPDFYFLVQPLCLKDSLITHTAYASQNPPQFSHLLPQKELQITFYGWIEKLPEKCWPKTFSFLMVKKLKQDPVELSRRQENKLTKCSVVVRSTRLEPAFLPTNPACPIELCDLGEVYLTSLCFSLLICKMRVITVFTLSAVSGFNGLVHAKYCKQNERVIRDRWVLVTI